MKTRVEKGAFVPFLHKLPKGSFFLIGIFLLCFLAGGFVLIDQALR